ncbi:MAG: DUF1643 domain-containing protein [Oscillospiraceae bacterium]|nr:DUF1643 domain-containing protein [Oscillospiraceae bacterium]
MHIPECATQELDILRFDEALHMDSGGYDRERWLYVPDRYLDYRYILGTKGNKPLICIGINPSTAEPGNLDPTLKSVERIALGNGFDSFIMFNVYAQRATRPKDMEKCCNECLHRENMRAFDYILRLSDAPVVWAAWGTIITQRDYLARCLADMIAIGETYGAHWVSAGTRSKKGGHPHHPLYLRKDAPLEPFDVRAYCKAL